LKLCDALDFKARLGFAVRLRPISTRLERCAWRGAEAILAAILARSRAKFGTIAAGLERRAWCTAEAILTTILSRSWAKFRAIAARLERRAWRAAEGPLPAILPRSGAKFRTIAARLERRPWRAAEGPVAAGFEGWARCAAETILAAILPWSRAEFRPIAARFERRAWCASEGTLTASLLRSGAKFWPSAAARPLKTPPFRPVPFLRRKAGFFGQHLRDFDAARFHLALGRQSQCVHLIFGQLAHISRFDIEY